MDGTNNDVVFAKRWNVLKVLPRKEIEQIALKELSKIDKKRKEDG